MHVAVNKFQVLVLYTNVIMYDRFVISQILGLTSSSHALLCSCSPSSDCRAEEEEEGPPPAPPTPGKGSSSSLALCSGSWRAATLEEAESRSLYTPILALGLELQAPTHTCTIMYVAHTKGVGMDRTCLVPMRHETRAETGSCDDF